MNFNKVFIGGRCARDPQLKFLPSQTAVTDFSIATNRKFKDGKGEAREEVVFIDCVAFAKTAELINEYFRKGSPIFCEGRLKLDQWDDKQTGAKRSKLSVIVENFQFVGGKSDAAEDAPRQPAMAGGGRKPSTPTQEPPFGDEQVFNSDDVPFHHEWHRTPL